MACQWDILLNHGQYPTGPEHALRALESIEDWEERLSVFRPSSELSQINHQAADQPVAVSDAMWTVLELARDLWEWTGGAFDITSAPLSQCWGFLKREGRMPDEQEIAAALKNVGMDQVELNAEHQTVQFLNPQITLNLGGIGKGWALDQIAQQLREQNVDDFLFHAGQSSVVAAGNRVTAEMVAAARNRSQPEPSAEASEPHSSEAEPGIGWDVGVSHPLFPDQQLGVIHLHDQALGTSGSARQFVHYRGQRLSHILDPRTGRPAQGVLSATVLAPTAAQADALGTACFVLGPDACQELVQQIPDLQILMVVPAARGIEIVPLGDWKQQWQPA